MVDIVIVVMLIAVLIALVVVIYIQLAQKRGDDPEERVREMEKMNRVMTENLQRQHESQMSRLESGHKEQMAELTRRLESQNAEARRIAANEFELMGQKMYQNSSEGLREQNREQMDSLLEPLKQKLEEFGKSFRAAHEATNNSQQSLNGQIEALLKANQSIGEEARNLATALKGNVQHQGSWGEQVLQTLLENSGLSNHINFTVQQTRDEYGNLLETREGDRKRPDVVVSLPDGRKLIIDSKVSLLPYLQLTEAQDERERKDCGRKLVNSIRKHIDEIVEADYPSVIEGSADFCLMFIPNECAYFAAFDLDPAISRYASAHKVMIVTPMHLFNTMQIVSQLWRQDRLDKNARSIAQLSGELYDKFIQFLDEFEKVGKEIGQASDAYKKARNTVTRGKNSLSHRAEVLRELGAETSKAIPEKYFDEETDPAED